MRTRRRIARLLLVFIGLAIALISVEASLRLFAPREAMRRYTESPFARCENTVFGLKPNHRYHIRSEEYDIVSTTNSLGLRGPREYTPSPRPGERRILLIGDSLIYGAEVDDTEVVSSVMEDLARDSFGLNLVVINAAIPAYGPRLERLLLEDTGLSLSPDMVILGLYVGNDFIDVRANDLDRLAHVRLISRAEAAFRNRWFYPVSRRSHLFWLLSDGISRMRERMEGTLTAAGPPNRFLLQAFREVSPPGLEAGWDASLSEILSIADLLGERKIPFGVSIIPAALSVEERDYLRYLPEDFDPESGGFDLEKPHRDLAARLDAAGIRYIDLLPAMREARERGRRPLYYSMEEHMNAEGHAAMAEALLDWIIGTGMN